jgi:hypothetical protein
MMPDDLNQSRMIDFEWILALHEIDRVGDKQPLLELLRSNAFISPTIRDYLADLISRGVAAPKDQPRARATGLLEDDPWVVAVAAVDGGGKKPLMDLLLSNADLPQLARGYIADLIARGVAKPPSRPRTPAYTTSDKEAVLGMACEDVRCLVRDRGLGVREAVDLVAPHAGVDADILAKCYEGRRGHSQSSRKLKLDLTEASLPLWYPPEAETPD